MGLLTKMRTSYAQKRSSMTPYPEAGHMSKNSNAESFLLLGGSGSSCTSAESANPPLDANLIKQKFLSPAVQHSGYPSYPAAPLQAPADSAVVSRAAVNLKPRPSTYMPSLENDLMTDLMQETVQGTALGSFDKASPSLLPALKTPRRRPVSEIFVGQQAPIRRAPGDHNFSENLPSGPPPSADVAEAVSAAGRPLVMKRKPPSSLPYNVGAPAPVQMASTRSHSRKPSQLSNSSFEYQRARPNMPYTQDRVISASQRAPFAASVNGNVEPNKNAANIYAEEWLQFQAFLSQYLANPQNREGFGEQPSFGMPPRLAYVNQLLQMQDQNPNFARAMQQHVLPGPQPERFNEYLRSLSPSSLGHSRALSECFQSVVSHFPPVRGRHTPDLVNSSSRASQSPVQYSAAPVSRRVSLSPLISHANQVGDEGIRCPSNASGVRSVSYSSVGSKIRYNPRDTRNASRVVSNKNYRDFSREGNYIKKYDSIMSKDRMSNYNVLFFDENGDTSLNDTFDQDDTIIGADKAPEKSSGAETSLPHADDVVSLSYSEHAHIAAAENDLAMLNLEGSAAGTNSSPSAPESAPLSSIRNSNSSVDSQDSDNSLQRSANIEYSTPSASQSGPDNGGFPQTKLPSVSRKASSTAMAAGTAQGVGNGFAPGPYNDGPPNQSHPTYYEDTAGGGGGGYRVDGQYDAQGNMHPGGYPSFQANSNAMPAMRRLSQPLMNFEPPEHTIDARSEISARLSTLSGMSQSPLPSPQRWNQGSGPRPMSVNAFNAQGIQNDQYAFYNWAQQNGHDFNSYQQGPFHPFGTPDPLLLMSADQYNAMKRMLMMSLQGQQQSPGFSPSSANFGTNTMPLPVSTGNDKLDSRITKLVELRQVIASGNKSVEYRLKWVKLILDATNYGVYEYVTIKGEPSPPGQELRSKATFVRSLITQASKLLNECDQGKHEQISSEVYYLHGCLAMHAFRDTYCQDFGVERDFDAAKIHFERCLEVDPDNSRALFKMGELQELMFEDDIMPALSYYKQSAKAGYNRAIFRIGMLYLNDPRVRSARFIKYLVNLSSIDPNDIELNDDDREDLEDVIGLASFQLGRIYEGIYPPGLTEDDEFVQECLKISPVNYTKSLAYYNKSAKLDCLLAQVKLGNIYERGELDRPPNASKSVQWYLKASTSLLSFERHPEAMMGLVRWCLSGTNLASKIIPHPNHAKAVQWCERAMEEFNFAEAYFCMGELATNGIINSDPESWYAQARELGYEPPA